MSDDDFGDLYTRKDVTINWEFSNDNQNFFSEVILICPCGSDLYFITPHGCECESCHRIAKIPEDP